jgi:hypothetical protein
MSLQLKAHVQGQSIFPLIDNTYSAKAVNKDTLDKMLRSHGSKITEIVVSLQCLLFVFILVAVITVAIAHGCSHKWYKTLQKISTANVHLRTKQASILAVVIVSYVIISYIIALDIAALARHDRPFNDHVLAIYNKNQSGPIYNIHFIVSAFDFLGALFLLGMTIVSIILHVRPCQNCSVCCNTFFFLVLSTLGLICCIVTHVPFIAIAYLNDAYHAGSIFAFYTIISLILFAVVELLIVSCQKKFDFEDDTSSSQSDRCLDCPCGWCTTSVVGIAMASLLSITAILTCYFVIIPINRSISDAPNRLVGVYESAILLVGAYIAYKAFFTAKSLRYLERSVINQENPIIPNQNHSGAKEDASSQSKESASLLKK